MNNAYRRRSHNTVNVNVQKNLEIPTKNTNFIKISIRKTGRK